MTRGHRGGIALTAMLATVMQTIDTTIANVALPHMQGALLATQESIAWVLTSYIVAGAICMPLAGALAPRVGRKRLFLWSVAGFTVASMLCGAAQTLEQAVAFRLLQGIFGASLVPISQAVLLDAYPRERHAYAMAMWGVGITLGPILGPTLGGWLTEHYSWRWVFYINLPVGLLAFIGVALFVQETPVDRSRRFDTLGFGLLALGIGALQLMLDRGTLLDWFASPEIVIEAIIAGTALYLFVAHTLTHSRPFLDPGLFRDRNFVVGLACMFIMGMVLLATLALLPPFMQALMGYPIVDIGILLAPRGFGTMIALYGIGLFGTRLDARVSIITGLAITSWSLWDMSHFTADVSGSEIARTGFIQGFGLGLVYAHMTPITFSTLAVHYRNEGTAIFNLARAVGNSMGVSIAIACLAYWTQANHAGLAALADPASLALRESIDLATPEGIAALDAIVRREAATLAYLQDFRLIMWATLAAAPLALLLRVPKKSVKFGAISSQKETT